MCATPFTVGISRHSFFVYLFKIRSFALRSLRTCRLRYEINTTKTKLNKSLHFFDAGKVSVAICQTIWDCVVRKTTFRTRKRFHNKQYPLILKDKQPLGSDCTHFDVRFNKNIAMHRPTIIFLLSHKITTVQ